MAPDSPCSPFQQAIQVHMESLPLSVEKRDLWKGKTPEEVPEQSLQTAPGAAPLPRPLPQFPACRKETVLSILLQAMSY